MVKTKLQVIKTDRFKSLKVRGYNFIARTLDAVLLLEGYIIT